MLQSTEGGAIGRGPATVQPTRRSVRLAAAAGAVLPDTDGTHCGPGETRQSAPPAHSLTD